jgi:hypothetical protein
LSSPIWGPKQIAVRQLRYCWCGVWFASLVSPRDITSGQTQQKTPFLTAQVKVKVMLRPTVPSASPSWSKVPIWGLRPHLYYCWTVAGLLIWGALSDERTGLSFARLSQQY